MQNSTLVEDIFFNMTRFVHYCLIPLLLVLTTEFKVCFASQFEASHNENNKDNKMRMKREESFYMFDDNSVRRRLQRSISSGSVASSSGGGSFTNSPVGSSDAGTSISADSAIIIAASRALPDRLVNFLAANPFPFQVDKFRPFDPMETEIWINYFVSSKLTVYETFTLIEGLFEDLESETNATGWFFGAGNRSKVKVVEIVFDSALSVYFKGNLNFQIRKMLLDWKLQKCSEIIKNKLTK